ncbi:AfsR/SARP family transcriptional regulator [Solihabitans fulvus]|uniref:AfsR/SARP family transcriptional regulator n=1 Tax=Solihabitans fulvus TaxID=1892852 RepID=UPI001661A12E|nr:BTAD domain-containing putative transcriptional regulator [Solihabitans fulvus]
MLEFRVLGPVELRADGAVVPLRAPGRRALLAALLLSANRVVTVDRLVNALWGQLPPPSAVANLRSHVAVLRGLLAAACGGEERVVTRPGGYLMTVRPGELDLGVFEDLVGRGRQALRLEQHEVGARLLGEALDLWRGQPLANVTLHGAGEAEVVSLEEARLDVVEDRLRALLACGDNAAVIGAASGLVVEHPLREPLWALLMLALHRAGRQADALAAYTAVRTRLAEELGLDPGQELRRLQHEILVGDATRDPQPPPSADAVAHCDLPGDTSDFSGREAELHLLLSSVRADGKDGTAVAISAIDGMAGVGKTTLAVHLAHRLTPRYPDGQLFVDLHAHTPGRPPLAPAAALGKLLRAAGVPGDQIPEDVEDRAVLWRATLAERRALVVLDNAVDSAQVRPLLPGARGCLVLVTSRRRLAGLAGALLLSLPALPHDDAVALFEHVVCDARPAAEAAAVAEVLALCGRLPLAIRIAATRLRHRPSWTIARFAARLRGQRRRLPELHGEDSSVTAAFDLSYQHLDADQRRLFRLLGLHPGADIDLHAAAALAGLSLCHAEDLLEDLVDAHLLQQPAAGRYCLHELLRIYAADRCGGEDADADRRAALTGLLDHYLRVAEVAAALLAPGGGRPVSTAPAPAALAVADQAHAAAWLAAELANVLAAAKHAAEHGWPAHVRDLSAALARELDGHGRHEDAEALHTAAVAASRRLGDGVGEGHALHDLGVAHWRLGRHDDAGRHHRRALHAGRRAGERALEARALNGLGEAARATGQPAQALREHRRALAITHEIGDHLERSRAHTGLGHAHRDLDQHDEARDHWQQALAGYAEHGAPEAADLRRLLANPVRTGS